jgi:hypothetical protein
VGSATSPLKASSASRSLWLPLTVVLLWTDGEEEAAPGNRSAESQMANCSGLAVGSESAPVALLWLYIYIYVHGSLIITAVGRPRARCTTHAAPLYSCSGG